MTEERKQKLEQEVAKMRKRPGKGVVAMYGQEEFDFVIQILKQPRK